MFASLVLEKNCLLQYFTALQHLCPDQIIESMQQSWPAPKPSPPTTPPPPSHRQAIQHTPPFNSSTHSFLLYILFKKEAYIEERKKFLQNQCICFPQKSKRKPIFETAKRKSCPKPHICRVLCGHHFLSIKCLTVSSKPITFFLYTFIK